MAAGNNILPPLIHELGKLGIINSIKKFNISYYKLSISISYSNKTSAVIVNP